MISKVLRKYNYFIPIEHIIKVEEDLVTVNATSFPVKIATLDLDKEIEICFNKIEDSRKFQDTLLAEIDEFHGLC